MKKNLPWQICKIGRNPGWPVGRGPLVQPASPTIHCNKKKP